MWMPFRIDAHSLNDCLIKGNNDYTHKPFNPLTPKWPASSFSLQYHPWIKHQGHEYQVCDHQLKKFLIVKQILLVSTLGKFIENSVENMHTYFGVERVEGKKP